MLDKVGKNKAISQNFHNICAAAFRCIRSVRAGIQRAVAVGR